MAELRLEAAGPGRVRLAGALTHETVPALLERGLPAAGEGLTVDLAGLDRVDSAGLALLIEWLRRARGTLRYEGAPQPLRALARVGGVAGLLGLAGP
ncbi:STAS domain-containing protein [Inmirania thermothiophila]|uniref:Phospholipid transport system transporter-binding protein n=1 Tax=Inmirania thermothiophila TaxID=1750597 RepID=A0A3N1XT02_9GAMM|nr:STAS domain-containing protein [Inmirania thermothiophila]ROR29770.1 phospholipid transport system transporter-binding protein [Inmirania thermothiophila]